MGIHGGGFLGIDRAMFGYCAELCMQRGFMACLPPRSFSPFAGLPRIWQLFGAWWRKEACKRYSVRNCLDAAYSSACMQRNVYVRISHAGSLGDGYRRRMQQPESIATCSECPSWFHRMSPKLAGALSGIDGALVAAFSAACTAALCAVWVAPTLRTIRLSITRIFRCSALWLTSISTARSSFHFLHFCLASCSAMMSFASWLSWPLAPTGAIACTALGMSSLRRRGQ